MALLAPFGRYRALDNNGNPLNGGLLYTYEAGTSTPKDTFTDASENTKNDNPVVLDANGYADVWLESGSYKFVLKDSSDVTLWTTDDISSGSGGSYANSVVVQSTNLNLTSVYEGNLIVCDTALTITLLPSATAGEGFVFIVKNSSNGDVIIDPDGAETIDGLGTYTLKQNSSISVVSDGTNWLGFSAALDVPKVTTATVAGDDKVLIKDTDDSDTVKTVTAQSLADLSPAGRFTHVETITASNVSTVVFDNISSDYPSYMIEWRGVYGSTIGKMNFNVSTDNGSTWEVTSDYTYQELLSSGATTLSTEFSLDIAFKVRTIRTASSNTFSGSLIFNELTTNTRTSVRDAGSIRAGNGGISSEVTQVGGLYNVSNVVNAIRIQPDAGGTFNGTFILYAINEG